MLVIQKITKADQGLQAAMRVHYSKPKGFVGRQLFYKIIYNNMAYGYIAFGSATKHLPGRILQHSLNCGMNNIFYHIEKVDGKYPIRNFTTQCLLLAETIAVRDYKERYGDAVLWIETLVELPRTGDLYKKAGYKLVGETKGYTCKRVSGDSTDNWTGRRVWDTTNLRPKHVFIKELQPKDD